MRKLADALHIKAASLYWHFDNKQTLIEGMADRIVSEVAVDFHYSQDWKADLKRLATELREAFFYNIVMVLEFCRNLCDF